MATRPYPRWRRRNFLVNRRLQLRFMGLLVLHMSLILAALGGIVLSHVKTISDIAQQVPALPEAARQAMQRDLIDSVHAFYVHSLALVGVTVALFLLFGLLASHKLAGPVVKLEAYLKALASGDFGQRIAFRRYDHLDDFARSVNEMTESLDRRRQQLRDTALAVVRTSRGWTPSRSRTAMLDEMTAMVARLREAV